jgi:hypothetical protein
MKRVKAVLAALGVAAAISASACGHHEPQYIQSYDVVCDPHAYIVHDYHCGYMDHDHWVYFGWAHPGVVSRAPVSWKPPKSVRSKYQTTRVTNPKYKAKAPKPSINNKQRSVTNPNMNVHKSSTNKVRTNPGYRPPIGGSARKATR